MEMNDTTRKAACQFTFNVLKRLDPMERDQLFAWIDMADRPEMAKLVVGLLDKASRRR